MTPPVVERGSVGEVHPVERVDGHELDVISAVASDQLEELVDQIGGGHDRRARVEAETVSLEHARTAPWLRAGLHDGDVVSHGPKANGGSEAAESGADDDDGGSVHEASFTGLVIGPLPWTARCGW